MGYWLSYGGGVNSTALAVMIVKGLLPEYGEVRFIFSDTGNEKLETIQYINQVFIPFLYKYGKDLIIVKPEKTVLERWKQYEMTGSRTLRSCTDHGKIRPIMDFVKMLDDKPEQLIGIDAGEPHRAKLANKKKKEFPKHYPLVDRGIDRDGCIEIIRVAGLSVPVKSGCWHCPFMRVREILELASSNPNGFKEIMDLEEKCKIRMINNGNQYPNYYQWRDKPASYWQSRAIHESKQMMFEFDDLDPAIPCICYD